MTPAQELFNATRKRLEQKVEGCKACGGSGKYTYTRGIQEHERHEYPEGHKISVTNYNFPCPTCAPYRALLEGKYKN